MLFRHKNGPFDGPAAQEAVERSISAQGQDAAPASRPLSRQAIAIIAEIEHDETFSPYLFPSLRSTGRPMSDNTINAALRRMGYGQDEMTAHGFRAMAATLLNEMGMWNRDAIERQLAYTCAQYWDECVAMMRPGPIISASFGAAAPQPSGWTSVVRASAACAAAFRRAGSGGMMPVSEKEEADRWLLLSLVSTCLLMPRRPAHTPLDVLINGRLAGPLSKRSDGAIILRYDREWLDWEYSFPVSLSLPLRETAYAGETVAAVFDNLLPDSEQVRRRVAERTGAEGLNAYSLLARIGRDCVGALQFLPAGSAGGGDRSIRGEPLDDDEIEGILANLARAPLGIDEEHDFRISVAGA